MVVSWFHNVSHIMMTIFLCPKPMASHNYLGQASYGFPLVSHQLSNHLLEDFRVQLGGKKNRQGEKESLFTFVGQYGNDSMRSQFTVHLYTVLYDFLMYVLFGAMLQRLIPRRVILRYYSFAKDFCSWKHMGFPEQGQKTAGL